MGAGRTDQWVLCFYYFMGISQNLLIFAMKTYYARQQKLTSGGSTETVFTLPGLQTELDQHEVTHHNKLDPVDTTPAGEGTGHSRQQYALRRLWFKANRVGHQTGRHECRLKVA